MCREEFGASCIDTNTIRLLKQHQRVWSIRPESSTLRQMSFGAELRRRRKALRLTLEQVAERAGLSPNYVGSIENGRRDPSLSTVLALAKALRVPVGELFGATHDGGGAALEAARLVDALAPDSQEALLAFLRTLPRRRR